MANLESMLLPIRQYLKVLSWVWRDSIVRFRNSSIAILVTSLAGLGCQVAAFTIVLTYARALEKGSRITLLSQDFAARESKVLLVGVALASALAMLAGAGLIYFSKTHQVHLRRRYEEFCRRRALVSASRLPHPSSSKANLILAAAGLSKVAKRDARSCGRTLNLVLNMVTPIGSLVICLGVMFWISILFSFVFLLLAGGSLFFLYEVNRAAAGATRRGEEHQKPSSKELRELSNRIDKSAAPMSLDDPSMEDVFERGETAKFLDAFFGRFFHREQSRLVLNILGAVSMLIIVLIAGGGVIGGTWEWSLFLAFVTALRFFLNNSAKLGTSIVMISRFYPQVHRYSEFVRDAERAMESEPVRSKGASLCLDVPSLEGGGESLIIKSGERVYFIYDRPVGRNLAVLLQNRTIALNGEAPGSYWFVGQAGWPGRTLRESFGFPVGVDDEQLKEALGRSAARSGASDKLAMNLDEVVSEPDFDRLGSSMRLVLGLLAAVYSERSAIILGASAVTELEAAGQSELLEELSERILIVASPRAPPASEPADTRVLLPDEEGRLVWCTLGWVASHPDLLEHAGLTLAGMPSAGEDEDEDDEDDE